MAAAKVSAWSRLPVNLTELCIDTTLRCGQSFRWRKLNDEWSCVLHGRVVSLKQDSTHLHYRVTWPATRNEFLTPPLSTKSPVSDANVLQDGTEDLLRHYLSLKLDLGSLYEQWSAADPNFRKRAPKFEGVRILSQDAWETLIAFICSSNNNISRISQMVLKLCQHYGPLIGHVGGEAFHDFPTPEALCAKEVEAHLRELGFGYRAKYIVQTARIVAHERPKGWLDSLTNPDNPNFRRAPEADGLPSATYKEAHEKLLELTGVGPKVADCVCLMGLGWGEAVPVDTHVWQIAQRDYKFGKAKAKTLNKAMYDAVGDHFRELWGAYAGWAHSVLFTADLKTFSERGNGAKTEEITKQEGEVVMVKKEEEEGLRVPEVVSNRTKRRRRATQTDIKVEVTVGVAEDVVEQSPKRRRTRSQAKSK
ncbi:DNA glycosylase [Sodiomyces alkalinus F11]|uniref:DNA-(apurinic or apyrimidinic site) lyase n=1 Tax=Sodiomyces alkalinus (strain CBS 110278 / VKM F-3762 / F11) TaxID=1314773 RepID=A0A3N2PRY9_SODAK|nr:DNA glycosylase [Sodiomyces alkalinus F11]ROT37273.1 DNA glycosylase [Sodiomyces alkalinus F11]